MGGKRNPRGSARCILDGGRGGIREEGPGTGMGLCCALSLGVRGKGDGVWEGCPKGRGRGDMPLPGLSFFRCFLARISPGVFTPSDPGALGTAQGSGRGRRRWQDEELAVLVSRGCCSPDSRMLWGASGAAGLLSLLLLLGSPRMQGDEWIH